MPNRPRPISRSYATLPDAIRLLASCCDGAVRRDNLGFKREHVNVGHQLARLPNQHWDKRAVRVARTFVRIYRVQLERAGYNIDSLLPGRRRPGRRRPKIEQSKPRWAPDPAGLFNMRWWNGARWTHHVQ